MKKVIVTRDYNKNTIDWKDAFYNFNESIAKKELIKTSTGYFVSHNAERIQQVKKVLKDLECKVAHIYIGIDINNPGFDMHVDNDDVWFWQNKGITEWQFKNNDKHVLYEGDLIYVPKGVYHKVNSLEARFGISMSKT